MKFNEFAPKLPKTPDQLKVDTLKAAKDRASQSLQAERKRQQVTKAQQKLATVQRLQTVKPQ